MQKIENDVPIPGRARATGITGTMRLLEVGQSAEFAVSVSSTFYTAARNVQRENPSRRYTVRKTGPSLHRVWRIADAE